LANIQIYTLETIGPDWQEEQLMTPDPKGTWVKIEDLKKNPEEALKLIQEK
jgi:hypothetical protein